MWSSKSLLSSTLVSCWSDIQLGFWSLLPYLGEFLLSLPCPWLACHFWQKELRVESSFFLLTALLYKRLNLSASGLLLGPPRLVWPLRWQSASVPRIILVWGRSRHWPPQVGCKTRGSQRYWSTCTWPGPALGVWAATPDAALHWEPLPRVAASSEDTSVKGTEIHYRFRNWRLYHVLKPGRKQPQKCGETRLEDSRITHPAFHSNMMTLILVGNRQVN